MDYFFLMVIYINSDNLINIPTLSPTPMPIIVPTSEPQYLYPILKVVSHYLIMQCMNLKASVIIYIYNSSNSIIEFEWYRSYNIKINGTISNFNFESYFSEKSQSKSNENELVNENFYNYETNYPIPSDFDIDIYSKWVDSSLSSDNNKIQGSTCNNSDDLFWMININVCVT